MCIHPSLHLHVLLRSSDRDSFPSSELVSLDVLRPRSSGDPRRLLYLVFFTLSYTWYEAWDVICKYKTRYTINIETTEVNQPLYSCTLFQYVSWRGRVYTQIILYYVRRLCLLCRLREGRKWFVILCTNPCHTLLKS